MGKRTAIVTGAGLGIGKAITFDLLGAGWSVIAIDLNEGALEEGRAERPDMVAVVGDVAAEDTWDRAIREAEQHGGFTALVNCAGIPQRGKLDLIDLSVIERTIAVNLTAVVVGCQRAIRSFLRTDTPGAIVNISSVHARAAFPGTPVYDACKGAVEALTRQLCLDYGAHGIRVNAVAPGAVMSDRARLRIEEAGPDSRQIIDEMRALSPMGLIGESADVAFAVSYLLSDQARFVNGSVLAVDGGAAAGSFGVGLNR